MLLLNQRAIVIWLHTTRVFMDILTRNLPSCAQRWIAGAAWYIPSRENQRVIILVHGYNNGRTNGFLDEFVPFACRHHDAGFFVMMIDLRGHGLSEDARSTWLEQRGYQAGNIGVLGYSLGAGSVIAAAAEEADIGAVWVDSLFADIQSVMDHG